MLQRYYYFQDDVASYAGSKFILFQTSSSLSLSKIIVQAGLYNPAKMLPQHSLILSSITGRVTTIAMQLHGKRRKRTSSLDVSLVGIYKWTFLDKFIHELFPALVGYKTPKFKKSCRVSKSFSLRVRNKLTIVDDFHDLVEPIMYDTYRGIYLPLTLHLNLNKKKPFLQGETLMHMLRLPIIFFRKRGKPAFDDANRII